MPISTECPECGRRLKAPDSAGGRRARCPDCGAAVPIPEPVYDAEDVFDTSEDDYGDDEFGDETYEAPERAAPRKRPAENRRPCPMCGEMIAATAVTCRFCGEPLAEGAKRSHARLGTVRTAVAVIYYGLVTLLASAILGIPLSAALQSPAALVVVLLLIVAGMIAIFVGKLMCLAVPPQVGATALIYTSVGLDLVGIAFNVARVVTEVPPLVMLAVAVSGLVSTILFLLFLRRLCEFIRRPDLVTLAGQVLTLLLALSGAYLVLLLGAVAQNLGLVMIAVVALFVLLLLWLMRYGRLLTYLKDAL